LDLVSPSEQSVIEELDFITALSVLAEFNVSILPLQGIIGKRTGNNFTPLTSSEIYVVSVSGILVSACVFSGFLRSQQFPPVEMILTGPLGRTV
jgi:hypothetical protein